MDQQQRLKETARAQELFRRIHSLTSDPVPHKASKLEEIVELLERDVFELSKHVYRLVADEEQAA